jgi:CxxC motif-containing protein
MKKNITCIECPKGCTLSVDIENCRVVKVEGNQCPKGEKYAYAEIENPVRILTSAVSAEGLSLKMVPVRTNKPIPKSKMQEAMKEIRKITLKKPVKTGDVISANILNLGADLISTRTAA